MGRQTNTVVFFSSQMVIWLDNWPLVTGPERDGLMEEPWEAKLQCTHKCTMDFHVSLHYALRDLNPGTTLHRYAC